MNDEMNGDGGLYLDLMKRCLMATIYDESAWYVLGSRQVRRPKSPKGLIQKLLIKLAWLGGYVLVKPLPFDSECAERRKLGRGYVFFGHTMIGAHRLDNIQSCVEDVLRRRVPGDLIETGAWRGGATILMRAVLKYHGVMDRTVWVADCFEGLPRIRKDEAVYPGDAEVDVATLNWFSVPLEKVKANFARYGLLDGQVQFLKGWFKDTLPSAPIGRLAVLRLDGDMYSSTMDALTSLYDKVSRGGYVIVDDYNSWPHCRQAVDDFRSERGISDKIIEIDRDGVFWQIS